MKTSALTPKTPSTSPGRHLLEGATSVFLAESLLLLTGVITVSFLTRRLGAVNYGLFTLSATLIALIEFTITSLFARATVKFVSDAEDWRPVATTVMRLLLLISGGVTLLVWLMASPIAALLGEPVLATYLRVFALDIPLFTLAKSHRNILVGMGGYVQRARMSAGRWITRFLLIVLLVEWGLSVEGAILGSIGASIVELTIGRFYVRPSLSGPSTFAIRSLWGYAVPLFLSALALRLLRLDLFALKILGGTQEQVGFYGAAQNFSLVVVIFGFSISPLLLSTLSRVLREGNFEKARGFASNAMRSVVALLPFAVMTAGAANEIASVIFGPKFVAAAPLMTLLLFSALARVMIMITNAILIAAGKPRWTLALTGPLLPVAIVGHLIMIPRLGALGAAVVTVSVACMGALASVLAVRHLWRILPPATTLLRSVLLSGLAFSLAVLWPTAGFLVLLKLPMIGIVILSGYLLLGEFTTQEIDLLRSLFPGGRLRV